MPWWVRSQRVRKGLTAAYVGAIVLAGLVLVFPPLRDAVAERVTGVIRSRQGGWGARVERGEAMVREGRLEEAVAYLETLDDAFPARTVRHSLDKEREAVLLSLGAAYAGLDRKRRSLDAFARAVAFDPHNVASRFAFIESATRFDEADLARAHLDTLLAIHPSHVPAMALAVQERFEGGRYAEAVSEFERYLNAFRVQPIRLSAGDPFQFAFASLDGRVQSIRVDLADSLRTTARLRIDAPHPTVSVQRIRWSLLPKPGRASEADSVQLAPSPDAGSWSVDVPLAEVGEIVLLVRPLVPVPRQTWEQVSISYGNLLDAAGLAAARERTALIDDQTARALAGLTTRPWETL